MVRHIDVVAAVMIRGNRILIARRAPGEHLSGKWEFPGGKIESGETPEECLRRELSEEFGVTVTIGPFLTDSRHTYPGKSIRLLAYRAEHQTGDFVLSVHDQVAWVAPDQLLSYDLAPADVPIARHIAASGGY